MDIQHLAHRNSEARKALAILRLIEKKRDRLIGDTRKFADSLKRTFMSHFSANSGEPFFTVRAHKVDSRPIRNKAVVVFVRVLIKIS